MVNIGVIRPVLYHPVIGNVYRGRKGKMLAQLGRVDGVGKDVVQLVALVKPKPALVPPVGGAVALGQQKVDDRPQVVGARVVTGAVRSLGR